MPRLPQPGGDEGEWGTILNSYLTQSHNSDGTLKSGSVSNSAIQDGSITETKLAASLQTKINDSTSIDSLSDVNTGGASDGQSLVYQSGTWIPATVTSGSGVTDHGALTGLADDDHPQYHNNARGDARYYTQTQLDSSLAGKVGTDDSRLSDARTPLDNSVSTAKVQDNAITEPKLSVTNTPTSGHVLGWNGSALAWVAGTSADPTLGGDLSGTASNAQITTGAVGTTELATNAVTSIKITDNSVTDAKLASGISQSKITNLTTDLASKANSSHTHAAADISSGTIAAARLGSGTASNTTYLRGDGTWATPSAAAGGMTAVARTGAYTASAGDFVIADASAGGFTVTLPAPANGAMVSVKKVDSSVNAVLVARSGVQIDDQASISLNSQWQSQDFFSDGTKWYRV